MIILMFDVRSTRRLWCFKTEAWKQKLQRSIVGQQWIHISSTHCTGCGLWTHESSVWGWSSSLADLLPFCSIGLVKSFDLVEDRKLTSSLHPPPCLLSVCMEEKVSHLRCRSCWEQNESVQLFLHTIMFHGWSSLLWQLEVQGPIICVCVCLIRSRMLNNLKQF